MLMEAGMFGFGGLQWDRKLETWIAWVPLVVVMRCELV